MHYPPQAFEVVMPIIARLPLNVLTHSRHLIGDTIYADVIAAKLRATYEQAGMFMNSLPPKTILVGVYQAIHIGDHFTVQLPECPHCHQKPVHGRGNIDQASTIPIHCSPCHAMIGCEQCMRDRPCVCDPGQQYHAVYHCESLVTTKEQILNFTLPQETTNHHITCRQTR